MLVYSIYFSAFSVRKHTAFQTFGYDFSWYIQPLWTTLHGDLLRMTLRPGFEQLLVVHLIPSILLLVPFYALWPDPACLLILQSLVVASGAWPIFRLSERYLQNAWLGAGYAGVYLLYPSLQAANLFDFHGSTLAAPVLAWALWMVAQKRWVTFGLLSAVAAGFREEVALVLFVLGIRFVLRRSTRKAGTRTAIATLVWFTVVALVLFPRGFRFLFEPGNQFFVNLPKAAGNPMNGLFEALKQAWGAVWRPEKTIFLLHLLAPVGYLSLLAPATLMPAVPIVMIGLLGISPAYYAPAQFHYMAPLSAFVVLAAAEGSTRLSAFLARRTRFSQRFLLHLLFGYVLALSLGYQTKLSHLPYSPHFQWPEVTTHHRLGEVIAQQIPPEASVSAQNPLAPHVSHRHTLYVFPFVGDAEYVFLDLTVPGTLRADGADQIEIEQRIQELLADPQYITVVEQDGYVLLRRR